jgi:hypothetical protein
MSAFNTVTVERACPFCRSLAERTVQFKYGNCWQFANRIGDSRWGGNKKGRNVGGRVRASGIVEERCSGCHREHIPAAIYFVDNVITDVELRREALTIVGYYVSLGDESLE